MKHKHKEALKMILPVKIEYYSGETLGDLSLPWYNYIEPEKTVEIANNMKSHATVSNKSVTVSLLF